jgi:hypothetical protein
MQKGVDLHGLLLSGPEMKNKYKTQTLYLLTRAMKNL